MFNHTFIKRALTVALITGAVAFPAAAQAQPAENGGGAVATAQVPVTGPQSVSQSASVPTAQSSGSSFQWGDAGIGAAGAVVLLVGAGAAGATLTRRRRRPALS
jgi:hypothetical protein